MTYNYILDTWFSFRLLSLGVPFFLIIALVVFGTITSKNKKWRFLIYHLWYLIAIFMLLLFTGAILNPIYLGYGSPVGIKDVFFSNGKLYVVDYINTAGSRGLLGTAYDRIHVLDPETGNKKVRLNIGAAADIKGIYGDRVAVEYYTMNGHYLCYYSVNDGSMLVKYSIKTLPKLFPELSSGVDDFSLDKDHIKITSFDGNEWNLDFATEILAPAKEKPANNDEVLATHKLFILNDGIFIDDLSSFEGYDSYIIKIGGKDRDRNIQKKYILNGSGELLNQDLVFLGGCLVAGNIKDSTFVLLHFETLKYEKFIFTCMSFDGRKKIWELKQSDIIPNSTLGKYHKIFVDYNEESGKMFFNARNEIFAVSLENGKVLWRQKL